MVASATTAVLMLASLTAAEESTQLMMLPLSCESFQRYASVSVVTTHIVLVNSVSDECRCAAQSMPALNALSLSAAHGAMSVAAALDQTFEREISASRDHSGRTGACTH